VSPANQGVKTFEFLERNGFSIVKYVLLGNIEGLEIEQLNYSAHIVREGYWIETHISKMPAKSQDIGLFNRRRRQ
jgi:hypothetical protein